MMKAENRKLQHTPGPWTIQPLEASRHGYDGWKTYAIRSNPENVCLAVVGEVDRYHAREHEANARLIAAAPELLDVLEEATWPGGMSVEHFSRWLPLARATIARATSQDNQKTQDQPAQESRPLSDVLNTYCTFLGQLRDAHMKAVNSGNQCAEMLLFDTLETARKLGDRLQRIGAALGGESPSQDA